MTNTYELDTGGCVAVLDRSGLLSVVKNRPAEEEYGIALDDIEIRTDKGVFRASTAPCSIEDDPAGSRLCFRYDAPFGVVRVIYAAKAGNAFIRRHIVVEPRNALQLLEVRYGATLFQASPQDSVDYQTFWNAPTVESAMSTPWPCNQRRYVAESSKHAPYWRTVANA